MSCLCECLFLQANSKCHIHSFILQQYLQKTYQVSSTNLNIWLYEYMDIQIYRVKCTFELLFQ